MPAVKHAIRQKVCGENERRKGKERKSERKETTTQRSRERARARKSGRRKERICARDGDVGCAVGKKRQTRQDKAR